MEEKDKLTIERFLSNECDYVEAERVAKLLLQDPELLDNYILFDKNEDLSPASYDERAKILDKILHPRRPIILQIKRIAVAAMILFLVGLGVIWVMQQQNAGEPAQNTVAVETLVKIKNSSAVQMEIVLPDSSTVLLQPFAEIIYDSAFQGKRDVFLANGTAYFKVRKNAHAPFSVYSKGVKTTALGTAFWVESPATQPLVIVRLTHGKVVLTSAEKGFKMNDVLLAPGQSCHININTGEVKVLGEKNTALKIPKQPVSTGKTADGNKAVLWTNNGMQFTKAELRNVLSQLEARYNITIVAGEDITKDVVLTGKLYSTDSLHTILKSICDMNKLDYEIKKDSVFLKKHETD